MILDYNSLTDTLPPATIIALVRDCLLSMEDFSQASAEALDKAVDSTMLKLKSGRLLVEYGEDSESFALVDKSKLSTITNN